MPNRVRPESPFADRTPRSSTAAASRNADVVLSEHPLLAHINLRGDPASAAFCRAVTSALACPLPLEPNTFVDGTETRACWLGPDEWLVICDGEKERTIADSLRSALSGQFAAVTEVSSGQTVVGLTGPRARDLLAKGCPLDLHPRVFGPGRCAQTYIARTGAIIIQTSVAPSFELVVRHSYADYFWLWLMDAAAEYSCAVAQPGPWKATLSEPTIQATSVA